MYRDLARYLNDVREIEAMFEAVDLRRAEPDTDTIEEMLSDWDGLISNLRDAGEHELANQVNEKIDEIEEQIRAYEQEQIRREEDQAVEESCNRLSRSTVENLISKPVKVKPQEDIGREHQAVFRLRDRKRDYVERLKRLEE